MTEIKYPKSLIGVWDGNGKRTFMKKLKMWMTLKNI